ncbi:MAG: antirestriction protein ArdA [Euryhalocaulis sp.]|uniref:antirestriction protein ArdA n=1 Tax=Euryhalocaulis sp. TaxID=2744307 RepID=UPI00180774C6|nr:antirestriction protein ArdA [Euryhalocaulis sp.]MBA4801082.1 antirestriction protein ArdA [Euryhalocaulis sp.]
MKSKKGDIRIYVACLAAYNNGILHGAWIDADQDAHAIRAEIQAMLARSPIAGAEEYAIHDYESFEGAPISEYEGIKEVTEIAAFIAEHGKLGGALLEYFSDMDDAKAAIEDRYAGEYRSVADFAEELTEQTVTIPESLQFYIDYQRMARDMEINDILAIETGFEEIHIFWTT